MELEITPEIDWLGVETGDQSFFIAKSEVGSASPDEVSRYVGLAAEDPITVTEVRGFGVHLKSEWEVYVTPDDAALAAFELSTEEVLSQPADWIVADTALSWDHDVSDIGPGAVVMLNEGSGYGIAVIAATQDTQGRRDNVDVAEAKAIAADIAEERGLLGWDPHIIDTPSASVFEEAYQPNRGASCAPLSRRRGKWTSKYKDSLPDSHFLYVGSGGTKTEGRTHPLSLRKFPYKDRSGKLDVTHLRNALARISQSSLSAAEKRRVQAKAEKLYASCVGYTENRCPKPRLCTGDKIEIWSAAENKYFPADMMEKYGDGTYEIWFTEETPAGEQRRGRVHQSLIRGFVENAQSTQDKKRREQRRQQEARRRASAVGRVETPQRRRR